MQFVSIGFNSRMGEAPLRSSVVFSLFLLVSIQTDLYACENWVAKVVSVNGLVEIRSGSEAQPAQAESVVCPGQTIAVAENSRAAIYLSNNSFVRLDQNTVLNFPNKETSQGFWVKLQKGVSHFISRITQRFVVDAPYVNAAVDGTEFLVTANENENSVTVVEGKVTATSQGNQQAVTMGQKLLVSGEESTFRLTDIKAEEVIDWAVYYSPVPTLQELYALGKDSAIKSALSHIKNQRSDLALVQLENAAPQTEAIQVAKAAVLLSVGQSKAAQDSVRGITSAQSLALKSVIQSTRNNVESALQLAQQAVQKDEQSLSALLALSYAHQANLDLPSALDAARKATLIGENDSIAWARVSEMELAMGNIQRASKAIKRAQKQDASNPYVITQAGFIQLFRIKISNAKELFRQAIAQDSENPQAHLGLGLALLREGEMAQGRKQLEYATSLDPARSAVRSYLGRAYFEEKRDEEAATQWELAKQLDPNDPTPYFYEGVRKLFANDPIGAIEELETSRQLNDERALYRSETLLQSDAASRSATLARAYDEVGYDQGVLLSGWDALKNDPTSAEGHRLLADYYRGNSRYETARASELLQSQLWQPLSAYPLQPQLSEGDISFVEGSGPQKPGYNEFHSLFTQDEAYAAINGYGGNDATWANDLVAGFLAGPVAVSFGQYHFETDGWRENTEQNQDLYSLFMQYDYSPSTSFQLEARSLNWEHGFLTPYYLDDLDNSGTFEEDRETYRLGMRHDFSSRQSILVSLIRQNLDIVQSINASESDFESLPSDKIESAEVQYVFSGDVIRIIFGGGGWRIQKVQEDFLGIGLDMGLIPDDYDFAIDRSSDQLYKHFNINGYMYFQLNDRFELALGADFDMLDIDREESEIKAIPEFVPFPPPGSFVSVEEQTQFQKDYDSDQFSPKIGVSYELSKESSIRAALYKSYSRFQSANFTIEPTQFVGFNQLFDDRNYSESDNAGLGFEQNFNNDSRLSINAIARDVEALEFESVEGEFLNFTYSEYFLDAGYYVPLGDYASVGAGGNLAYRKYDDDTDDTENSLRTIKTAKLPIRVLLRNNDGWMFTFNSSYYLNRFSFFSVQREAKKKSQWVTDVSLEKRFFKQSLSVRLGVDNILGADDELSSYDLSSLMYYPNQLVYCNINFSI